MRRCADASFLIDVIRSDVGAVERLREIQLAGESLSAPAPAIAELLLGALLHQGQSRRETIAFAEELDTLPTDYEVAAEAAQIAAQLQLAGGRMPMIDVLIGATARLRKLALMTRDRGFKRIEGLVIDPY